MGRLRQFHTYSLAASLVALALIGTSHAQMTLPDDFIAEPVVTGLNIASDYGFAPDGRIYFAEKAGVVRVASDGALLPAPFIDLSERVNSLGDRGLTGITLHPRFPDVPYVYLAFSYDPPEVRSLAGDAGPNGGGSRVSRLIRVTADPAQDHERALAGSEVVLLGTNSTFEHIGDHETRNPSAPSCGSENAYVRDCLPADEHSHTIGRVRFGPDGALYVASGDGADYHRSQPYHLRALHLDSLAGKLLRIDPMTGDGLADNPFFDGDPTSNRSKVLSYGLRNPYSFTFDPETWEPVMGDVGWAAWEMVNVGRGRNFGWPCYEGGNGENIEQATFRSFEACQDLYAGADGPVTPPAYAYEREGVGGAIIVGEIYEGNLLPEEYRGALFIADYYQAWIRIVPFESDGGVGTSLEFARVPFPVDVRVGPDGHLHYLNIWEGRLVRLKYEGPEPAAVAPTVVARVSPRSGPAPLSVEVDASRSSATSGEPLEYSWRFGPGFTSTAAEAAPLFFRGRHTITLTVTNASGVSSTVDIPIRVGEPAPVATIDVPADGARYAPGDVIEFSGSGRSADGTEIPADRLRWHLTVITEDGVDVRGMPPMTVGTTGRFYAADRGEHRLELCLSVLDFDDHEDVTCIGLHRE